MKRIILLLFCVSACAPKVIQSTTTTVEKDSVAVTQKEISKKIVVPGDSTTISFNVNSFTGQTTADAIKKDSAFKEVRKPRETVIYYKQVKKGRLTETITIDNHGNVKADCKEDSLKEAISYLQNELTHYKTIKTESKKEVPVPRKLNGFEKFCIGFTIITLFIGLIFLGIKLKLHFP